MSGGKAWTTIRVILGAWLIFVVLFAFANASDRSPLQWESTFLCMFSWAGIIPIWAGIAAFIHARKQRTEARGFEVLPPRDEAAHDPTGDPNRRI